MLSKARKRSQWQVTQVKRRSISGCLACRRRRKKCDETWPTCKACVRNFLECTWPGDEQGSFKHRKHSSIDLSDVDVDYWYVKGKSTQKPAKFNVFVHKDAFFIKLKKTSFIFRVLIANPTTGAIYRYDSPGYSRVDLYASDSDEDVPCFTTKSSRSESSNDLNNKDIMEDDANCEGLDLQVDAFPQIEVPRNALTFRRQYLCDASFVMEEAFETLFQRCKNKEVVSDSEFDDIDIEKFAFYACIKGYIPKMTTQHTHQNLTTSAAFIPQLEKNPIVREVFLCCGATYLAWNNLKKFQNMSDELYINCKILIRNFIETNPNYADEDWLFGALQLLCNRDKNSLNGTAEDAKWHLMRAFDIIRLRYYGTQVKTFELSIIENFADSNLVLRPEERTLIESFIFQYSVTILFVESVDELPDPFKIFKILNVVLKCPVYNCGNVSNWMSNPILGPSLDCFELLAKISYIGRMPLPLSEKWVERLVKLQNMSDYYTPCTPPNKLTDAEWENFQINSKVGTITSRACWLVACKILEFDSLDTGKKDIQNAVKTILESCRRIPAGNRVWGILPWALLVTGLFSIKLDDRSFILELIDMMADRAHSYNGFKMSSFLRKAWASGNAPNLLFHRNSLMRVNM